MVIVEVDGTDIQESPIDVLGITVAQRYSVLVTARNDTSFNWVVHANMDTTMFDKVPDTLNPNITASITYNTSAPLSQPSPISQYNDINDTTLTPFYQIPQLPPSTQTIELEATFATMNDGTNRALFNGITYNSPLVPAVLSAVSLGSLNASVGKAYGPLSFVVEPFEVVDIVLKNGDVGKHPFHLHGHKPMLIGRAANYSSDDPGLNPPLVEGQANPMRRDTFQVPPSSSVTLRIIADNPGVWFLHCHIDWHLQAGLAVQLIEAPLIIQQRNTVPQILYNQCRDLGKPTSGNAAGHASTTDLAGLPLGPYLQVLGWRPKGIGAMTGCVLAAVIGMAIVGWYPLGGHISEEDMEHEVRERLAEKEKRGRRFFGLVQHQQQQQQQ